MKFFGFSFLAIVFAVAAAKAFESIKSEEPSKPIERVDVLIPESPTKSKPTETPKKETESKKEIEKKTQAQINEIQKRALASLESEHSKKEDSKKTDMKTSAMEKSAAHAGTVIVPEGSSHSQHKETIAHKQGFDSAMCKHGKAQSPVNLVWKKPSEAKPIEFHYKPTEWKVEDNGHTVKVNFSNGSWASIRGEKYELVQMHFHSGSEHRLSGYQYPMEAHFVHKNDKGELAVIGVFIRKAKNGESGHKHINTVWSAVPQEKNRQVAGSIGVIDPTWFMPVGSHYYHYSGSLTTPPCSEDVNWNVMNTPITFSEEQIAFFEKLYKGNHRDVQPLNGRTVELM